MEHPDFRALFSLENRVALVVGGGSGIGQAGAVALADFGAQCAVADVNRAGADATVAIIAQRNGRARAFTADVRNTSAVDQLFAEVITSFGRVDVVLAMPAMNIRKRLVDYSDEEFDRVIELNLKGTFRVARAAARQMKTQRAGSIILMSSMRGTQIEPGQSVYGSTKAAISLLTKGLASEMAEFNVRVNALAPSIIATPINAIIRSNPDWKEAYASRTALGRWGEAHEMAGPIVFLASDASSYVTGTTLFADGGWTVVDGRYKPPV